VAAVDIGDLHKRELRWNDLLERAETRPYDRWRYLAALPGGFEWNLLTVWLEPS
jgi:hypothetical protein